MSRESPCSAFRPPDIVLLRPDCLDDPALLVFLAHEASHYLLGHRAPTGGDAQKKREIIEKEAWAKAVEVLSRVRSLSEADAVRSVIDYLVKGRKGVDEGSMKMALGHAPACEEIAFLIDRFKASLPWVSDYGCR